MTEHGPDEVQAAGLGLDAGEGSGPEADAALPGMEVMWAPPTEPGGPAADRQAARPAQHQAQRPGQRSGVRRARPGRPVTRGIERAAKKAGMPVRGTSFSVPVGVWEQWRTASRIHKATLVDVMLTAVAAKRHELSDLVRAKEAQERPVVGTMGDGLFVTFVEPAKARREAEPHLVVPLRMLTANLDILDGLVKEAGAASRSALVTAALDAWLGEEYDEAADGTLAG